MTLLFHAIHCFCTYKIIYLITYLFFDLSIDKDLLGGGGARTLGVLGFNVSGWGLWVFCGVGSSLADMGVSKNRGP